MIPGCEPVFSAFMAMGFLGAPSDTYQKCGMDLGKDEEGYLTTKVNPYNHHI